MTQNLQLGLGRVCVVELLGWVRSAPSFLVPHLPMLPSSSWSSAGEEGHGPMAPQADRAADLCWGPGMVRAPWPGGAGGPWASAYGYSVTRAVCGT